MTENTIEAAIEEGVKKGLKPKPEISIIHDTARALGKAKGEGPKDSDLFPVKLQATFQVMKGDVKKWKQNQYQLYNADGTKVICTRKDYAGANEGSPRVQEQKDIRAVMIAAEAKAKDICTTADYITETYFDFLYSNAGSLKTVKSIFDLVIAEQTEPGTVKNYSNARDKVFSYAPDLTFSEITISWIKKFLSEIVNAKTGEELSGATKNIYLTVLKLAFKRAIKLRLVKEEAYPFGEDKIEIKRTEKKHFALSKEQKDKLESYVFTDAPGKERYGVAKKIKWAVDFWLLSFYCSGLNPADIMSLKNSEIEDEEIYKYRQKNINRKNKKLKIPIDLPEVKAIIDRYRVLSTNPDHYVFDFYTKGMTKDEQHEMKHKKLMTLNKYLKKAGRILGIGSEKKPFTMYTARHSYASILYAGGTPLEELQEDLGHATKDTTEYYTDGFPSVVKKKRQLQLTNSARQA